MKQFHIRDIMQVAFFNSTAWNYESLAKGLLNLIDNRKPDETELSWMSWLYYDDITVGGLTYSPYAKELILRPMEEATVEDFRFFYDQGRTKEFLDSPRYESRYKRNYIMDNRNLLDKCKNDAQFQFIFDRSHGFQRISEPRTKKIEREFLALEPLERVAS